MICKIIKLYKLKYKTNIVFTEYRIQNIKMNFEQNKLTKAEWNNLEIQISDDKLEILKLIIDGYENINITYNKTNSLFSFLKIDHSDNMDEYLYKQYFSKKVSDLFETYNYDFLKIKTIVKPKIKKADIIRIERNSENVVKNEIIYEFIMIDFIHNLLKYKKINNEKWIYYYFTIHKVSDNNIKRINSKIIDLINCVIIHFQNEINIKYLIYNSHNFIEKNDNLMKYSDISLYEHQKFIFTKIKQPNPKLILYIAPTGTGKTLTPIGLSQQYKVIYVCASRHISLALAKSAISVHKKIAFAFGCSSADDIRLHYFSAKEFTRDKKSGSIKKVDNSIGNNVEIIICDVKSYLPAMYYMLAFFDKDNIISYFDEPTIFLDYKYHPLHETIHKNWKDNLIPNIVLSSATLPKIHEIPDIINDFNTKFPNGEVINIVSHECKKTIPIINKNGYIDMPHFISNNYQEVKDMANHCIENMTLLRYLDLNECVKFIRYIEENDYVHNSNKIDRNFTDINEINMQTIKVHYLNQIINIFEENWNDIYNYFKLNRNKFTEPNNTIDTSGNKIRRISSMNDTIKNTGIPIKKIQSEDFNTKKTENENNSLVNDDFAIYITTKDSYTLTDGPTLFLAENIEKIAQFCIRQANIPSVVMDEIMKKINFNEEIKNRIVNLEKELDDIKEKKINKEKNAEVVSNKKTSKIMLNEDKDVGVNKIKIELDKLYSAVSNVSLKETFIPNKLPHLNKWTENINIKSAFTSNVTEDVIIKIMSLDVKQCWKVLLLMGIGVFTNHNNVSYNEIMKELADKQKLYLIISNSDYIYGTNYQFCHIYIGKDMVMTQEKIIQSMGRVGRGNIQQNYSIRFRDDNGIKMLFSNNSYKPEVENMNIIFTSKNISFDAVEEKYIEDNEEQEKSCGNFIEN